jgi:Tfp pilus assembly protein PilV
MILFRSICRRPARGPRTPGGFTLIETAVAAVLAGALLTVCLQMAAATARQRDGQDRRRTAVREAANAMERLAAVPLDELTPERAEKLETTAGLDEVLPGANLEIEVTSLGDEKGTVPFSLRENRDSPPVAEPPGQQITVMVRDGEDRGAAVLATLVRWRFR